MSEKDANKKREWVKNAAIIFLAVMLVLTFFSNTIMNYSLPEVATQYVQSGTITAKVRGTGNVEATDPYKIVAKETRTIESVAVKQGDEVEKDQVIYYLEEKESDELKKAENELEDLELAYMKGLFGANVSSEIISKVASGNVDGFSALQSKVTDMQNRIDAAKARVKECQDNVDKITLQSTVSTNNAGVNTIPEEKEKNLATNNLDNATTAESNAETAFLNSKAERVAELEAEIAELQKRITDLETVIASAENLAEDAGNNSAGINALQKNVEDAETAVINKLDEIDTSARAGGYIGAKNIDDIKAWITSSGNTENYKTLINAYDASVAQVKIAKDLLSQATGSMTGYETNSQALINAKANLKTLQAQLAAVNATNYTPGDSVEQAKAKLNQATQNLTDKTNSNKITAADYQNKLANANAALKTAQAVYDLILEEQKTLSTDINAELDLSKASKDIAEKEEEIEKLKEKSMGSAITAPMAGTITSLAYVAGESTKPEETAAVLQVAGKGFSLKISVTNEQAKKVKVGDTAELQNAWYYDDVQVILSAIKPDPDNAGTKKLLIFDVTGTTLQTGQSLSISVGQRSENYELVVPNSAIREDNNGKFILIVESKSSPLGNRYIATRVDVEVNASDDTNTAVTAPLYGYEYVITTSTKPVEAGKQVRLNE